MGMAHEFLDCVQKNHHVRSIVYFNNNLKLTGGKRNMVVCPSNTANGGFESLQGSFLPASGGIKLSAFNLCVVLSFSPH